MLNNCWMRLFLDVGIWDITSVTPGSCWCSFPMVIDANRCCLFTTYIHQNYISFLSYNAPLPVLCGPESPRFPSTAGNGCAESTKVRTFVEEGVAGRDCTPAGDWFICDKYEGAIHTSMVSYMVNYDHAEGTS